MESTRFIRKYLSLFQPAKVRYKVITGGRGSGKSFVISSALVRRTYDDDFNILFTRWTMESAKDSVIPEFKDKMEDLGDSLSDGWDGLKDSLQEGLEGLEGILDEF